MKKILRAKISYQNQFETLRARIIKMIKDMPDDDFVFVVEGEDGVKRAVKSNTLVGETLQIQNSPIQITVKENGIVFDDELKECLVLSRSLEQLKKISNLSKKTDVGHKIPSYQSKNILDGKVDTYEDYIKKGK